MYIFYFGIRSLDNSFKKEAICKRHNNVKILQKYYDLVKKMVNFLEKTINLE